MFYRRPRLFFRLAPLTAGRPLLMRRLMLARQRRRAMLLFLLLAATVLIILFIARPLRAVDAMASSVDKPAVVYTRDVAPILNANCVSCHHAGEAGPFPLTSYDEVRRHAGMIATVTQSRQMPPWKAEANYGPHFLNERHLSDADIATLAAWSAAGAPQGDPKDLPPAPSFAAEGEWQLGKPDKVVTMSRPFDVHASGPDVFRTFIIPLDIPDDRYVTAVEFRPSDRAVVHHALLFLDADQRGSAKEKSWHASHADDKQDGYATFGGIGFTPTGGLGGWAPGATPSFLPDGIARLLKGGSDLALQIHFHPTGKVEHEQSSVAIYFAKKPPTRVVMPFLLGSRRISIPAGDGNYVVEDSCDIPADMRLVGITPHAHLLCKQMDVWATVPSSTGGQPTKMPLIKIDDWDFNWQGQYRYAAPVILPKGATLHMRYVYDNSANNPRNPNTPSKAVQFGEQTTNEMAFCFLEVVPVDAGDRLAIRRGMVLHALSMR